MNHLIQPLVVWKLLGEGTEDLEQLDEFELANQGWNDRVKTEEVSRRRMIHNLWRTFVIPFLMNSRKRRIKEVEINRCWH